MNELSKYASLGDKFVLISKYDKNYQVNYRELIKQSLTYRIRDEWKKVRKKGRIYILASITAFSIININILLIEKIDRAG